ncbi:hypothetical protein AAFF_G00343800 [Aldrovandia affinis]|uniref:Calcium-binding and coiled-coil domain-containing protein 1 n=1 Tax=Aldrovandia affinis TaxID=143900 RepID=A0AAD7SJY2_9TELE|nr:hypothetical protein AAFF_G00343800 [Aldrovandia affinis]
MENSWKVEFRNVGHRYFPETRVECHYSLSAEHKWANCDWIGLFKVDWLSLRDYHTFVWALAPANYTEGTNVNFCVHFQASYLPRPSPTEYQFVYVDRKGQVCARSPQFAFCAPKPLDDLVTLEQERDGRRRRGGTFCWWFPEPSFCRVVWRSACASGLSCSRPDSQIAELKEKLRENKDKVDKLEEELQKAQSSLEVVTAQRDIQLADQAQSHHRVRELEDDIKAMMQSGIEKDSELEKMKERVKKMSMQRRDEEEQRKSMQMESNTILAELRGVQERLDASERAVEGLRAELSELATQRDHGRAELHQTRLQAAQLTLQLADAGLALREGRAGWAQDREALRNSAEMDRERVHKLSREVQRKEEWLQEERMERDKVEVELGIERDYNRVQLVEVRRELQEQRATLRVTQKEREQYLLEKQELMEYVRQLEQRLEAVADAKWTEAALNGSSRPSSPASSSEDENPEALQPPAGQLVTYSLCDPPKVQMLVFPVTPLASRDSSQVRVVISQPAPLYSPRQSEDDTQTHSSESEGEEREASQSESQSSDDETALLLPDHKSNILSELADSHQW